MPQPQIISFQEFLGIFKDNEASKAESRFCFILGAGASVASGATYFSVITVDTFFLHQTNAYECVFLGCLNQMASPSRYFLQLFL